MKYIKKVILENFQSHKQTEIEFDSGLNVIVGPSDQGKTAIIRGIKWVLFNEPSGDFFIREGENECSVTIVLNDNTEIKRYRSKNKNLYLVRNNQGEESTYEGFGTKVPQEIIDKTLIKKITLDSNQSSSINFGEQLDGAFLLSEKNATRANAIGRLVGVHIIDYALKGTLKDVRNLNIKKRTLGDIVGKLKNNLSEYDYLDELILTLDKLKLIREIIGNNQIRLRELNRLSVELKSINKEIQVLEKDLQQLKELNKIKVCERQLAKIINIFDNIFKKYIRLEELKKDFIYNQKLLMSLENIDRIVIIIDILEIIFKRFNRLNQINSSLIRINNLLIYNQKINESLHDIDKINNNILYIEKLSKKINQLINLKKRTNDINKSLSIGEIYIEKLSILEYIADLKYTINKKIVQLNKLIIIKNRHDTILADKSDVNKIIQKTNTKAEIQLEQYKKLLEMLNICPLCFSKIDKFKIDGIINNYK